MLHEVAIMSARLPRQLRARPAGGQEPTRGAANARAGRPALPDDASRKRRPARALALLTMGLFTAALDGGCQRSTPLPPNPTAIPSGQTLQVLTFPDYFGPNTLARFESETGNKVVATTYATNEELLHRLVREAANFDVVFPSSYAVERLILEDKLLPMQRDRVPNLVHVTTEFRNPPYDPSLRHCIPYAWVAAGLGYVFNKDSPPRQPDSLSALFSPTGPRVLWLDDMRATLGMALRQLGHSASSQQAADLLEAQQLLLSALPRVDGLVEDPAPLLSTGAVTLALSWSTELYNLHRERDDIRFAVAQEGAILYVDYACVLKGAKHPEVAFAFLNHLLEPQVAAEITNTIMLPLPNEPARRLLEGEGRTMWGLFEYLRNHNRSYETLRDVGPAQAAYEQAWSKVKESFAAQQARRGGPAKEPARSADDKPLSEPKKKPTR